ncbi:MAG TPA: superoxide dismutase, partial [Acidimicrobiia bacterium]|nr:superoxide dismutase [Acidimicrobiia bacterium]
MRQVTIAHAHCDLYCGVYDPAQAKIEAMSVLKIAQKYHATDDPVFRDRAILLKEERAEDVKHHLMVLWADFFTTEHREQFSNL